MKRILFIILLAVIGVSKISAQEVDLQQENSTDARIEQLSKEVAELSQKLEKQDDEFMFLSYKSSLEQLSLELQIFINNVKIEATKIIIWVYNSTFDVDLYLSTESYYRGLEEQYDSFMQYKEKLSKLALDYPFPSEKHDYIDIICANVDNKLLLARAILDYYKEHLDIYKKNGKGF